MLLDLLRNKEVHTAKHRDRHRDGAKTENIPFCCAGKRFDRRHNSVYTASAIYAGLRRERVNRKTPHITHGFRTVLQVTVAHITICSTVAIVLLYISRFETIVLRGDTDRHHMSSVRYE